MRRRSADRSTGSRLARAGLLACAIALGSIALACGKEEPSAPAPVAPPATEQAAPKTAPAPPAAAVPEEENAPEAIVTEGALPEGFPSDVPVYPGATIGSSLTTPGLGVFATFESDDAPEAILTHYRAELAKSGWSVVDTAQGDGVDASKENRTVQVRSRKNETNRSEIVITVTQG